MPEPTPAPAPVVKPLWKTATFWAGAATIVTSIGAYIMGEVDLATSIEVIGLTLVGVFIRRGMAK